jgi:tetratricopeptide (TPR) repeat protein
MFIVIAIIITIIAIIVIKAMMGNMGEKDLLAEAERGNAQAQYELAVIYQRKNRDSDAARLFEKSAESGYAPAQLAIGLLYKEGYGFEKKDIVRAFQWFQKAAEQGLADAQYNIACCYASGYGVKEDRCQAAQWFEKAAELDHADAQYKIGHCYMTGCGVDENDDKAIYWLQKAANNGIRAARDIMGFREIEEDSELKNCIGYTEIVKPLQYALVKRGYQLSGHSDKTGFGSCGVIYVYSKDKSSNHIGQIAFAKSPAAIGSWKHNLAIDNIGAKSPDVHAGEMKYMAIQNKSESVLLRSDMATATNDPSAIPEWLIVGKNIFEEKDYGDIWL